MEVNTRGRLTLYHRPRLPNAPHTRSEDLALRSASRFSGAYAPTERILLVAFGQLREIVYLSALAPALRASHPLAEITVWCTDANADIASLLPDVDRVEAATPFWRSCGASGRGGMIGFVRRVREMRRHGFDAAIVADRSGFSAMAARAVGIRRLVGYHGSHSSRWLSAGVLTERELPGVRDAARLLPLLGSVPLSATYRLETDPLAGRRARYRTLLGARPVALHPFAPERRDRVALTQWVHVAIELARRGYEPLWVGGARELDAVHRAVGSAAWKYVDRLGEGRPVDMAAALSIAHLFVGHDGAPLHIAAAFGVPVVGVYSPGDPVRSMPQGTAPSRMLVRSGPGEVTVEDLLACIDTLPVTPPLAIVR